MDFGRLMFEQLAIMMFNEKEAGIHVSKLLSKYKDNKEGLHKFANYSELQKYAKKHRNDDSEIS